MKLHVRDADGLVDVAERVLDHEPVLRSAEEEADGGAVDRRGPELIIHDER